MNDKQKKLLEYATKAEIDKLLPFFDVFEEIRDSLKILAEKEHPKMEMPEYPMPPEVQKISMEGVSVMTLKGDKGEVGERGEQGERGADGKDGKNGRDGVDGLNGLDGKDGLDGKNGENGKDGSPDTPEQIVEKVNKAESLIKKEKIEGLEDELTALKNRPVGRTGGARKITYVKRHNLSSLLTVGSNALVVTSTGNIGVGVANPTALLDFTSTSDKYAKMGTYDWGLRLGALNNGNQFIALGAKKTAANNTYVAETANDATVHHLIQEWDFDDGWRFKTQSHQNDETALSPTEIFTIMRNGNVGIGSTTPTTNLQVATTTANATSTLTVGKTGQTKGSCLELFDAVGTAYYVSVVGGALQVTTTSCK